MAHSLTYWNKNWLVRANNHLGLCQGMKDFSWVDRQVKKGRLAPRYREHIAKLMPVLESVYPGKWDIQFNVELVFKEVVNLYGFTKVDVAASENNIRYTGEEEIISNPYIYHSYILDVYKSDDRIHHIPIKLAINTIYIIIHFPEVTISNSKGETLLIRDIFTRTTLRYDGSISGNLYGARSTFTISEMSSNYIHSHLTSLNWYEKRESTISRLYYETFCLGESDLITFAQMYGGSKNINDFKSYLYMLQTVVSWESLEGGPHVPMSSTISRIKGIPAVTIDQCSDILQKVRFTSNFDIDWVFKNNKYHIVDNEKFEDFFISLFDRRTPYAISTYKDETGSYFIPSVVTGQDIKVTPLDYIPFRGKKHYLKVEGELKLVNKHKWYINPTIKYYVKSKLEYICNKIETKKYTIEWLNKVINNGGVLEQS